MASSDMADSSQAELAEELTRLNIEDVREEMIWMKGVGNLIVGQNFSEKAIDIIHEASSHSVITGMRPDPLEASEVPMRPQSCIARLVANDLKIQEPKVQDDPDAVEVRFTVIDLNFKEAINFTKMMDEPALLTMLRNPNLHIYLEFTTEDANITMIAGLRERLRTCKSANSRIAEYDEERSRIPWRYHARDEDMMAHLEVESVLAGMEFGGGEWEDWNLIKESFHNAPLL